MSTTSTRKLTCMTPSTISVGVVLPLMMCVAPLAMAEDTAKVKLLNAPATTGSLKPSDAAPGAKIATVKPAAAPPPLTPAQQTADRNERDANLYALAAVDAGFPSPAQALFLAGELQLTAQQTTAIYDVAAHLQKRRAALDPRIEEAEAMIASAFETGLPNTAKWSGALRESEKGADGTAYGSTERSRRRRSHSDDRATAGFCPRCGQNPIRVRPPSCPRLCPLSLRGLMTPDKRAVHAKRRGK